MLSDREAKTLPEGERPFQIEDPDLAHSLEAVEPHLPRDHHRWALPIVVVLAVVLTVPGPNTLVEAEIAARKRPPTPRTQRDAAPFPAGRPTLSARPPSGHLRLHDRTGWRPGRTCVQRAAPGNWIKA